MNSTARRAGAMTTIEADAEANAMRWRARARAMRAHAAAARERLRASCHQLGHQQNARENDRATRAWALNDVAATARTIINDASTRERRSAVEAELTRARERLEAAERARERDGTNVEATTPTPTKRASPRKEILETRSPDWEVSCELSPLTAEEATPPRADTELDEDEAASEKHNENDAPVDPNARPPRPPSRGGLEKLAADDSWIQAFERAEMMRSALPLHVRPGKGFVCPFTGDVVEQAPSTEA